MDVLDNAKKKAYAKKGKCKYSTNEVLEAIANCCGIKKLVYTRLGCCRETFENYLKRNQEIRKAFANSREELKDLVESQLLNQVKEGNPTILIFLAKTLCKDRGYVERNEIQDVTPPQIIITKDEDEYFDFGNNKKF